MLPLPPPVTDFALPPLVLVTGVQMLLYGVAWLLCAGLLLRQDRRAVAHWGGAMLLMGAGWLLIGLRGGPATAQPPSWGPFAWEPCAWLAYPGAGLLLLAGLVLLRRGCELFLHQRPRDREHLAAVGLAAAGLLLLGPGAENAPWRVMLAHGAGVAIVLRAAQTLAPRLRTEYGGWPVLVIALPGALLLALGLLRLLQQGLDWGRPLELQPARLAELEVGLGMGMGQGWLPGMLAGAAALNLACLTLLVLRLSRRLQAASLQDSLTGLPNRRVIEARLKQEWRRWCRHTSAFTVLALELDQFRRINEFWGHPAGDEMLEQIGQRLQAGLREVDTVARTGGKEFLLLLPDTELAAALVAAERLRAGLADEPYRVRAQSLQITASIGLAQVRGSDAEVESVLARAQAALRGAKAEGGNRVACSSAAQEAPAAGG